jgi:hypothetical protein
MQSDGAKKLLQSESTIKNQSCLEIRPGDGIDPFHSIENPFENPYFTSSQFEV